MSVVILGMKMPKDENDFVKLVIFNDGRCFVAVGENEVTSKTGTVTARELPPHGRCIDADAFLAKLKNDQLFPLVEQYGMSGVIEAQPTVIPADPEGGADG